MHSKTGSSIACGPLCTNSAVSSSRRGRRGTRGVSLVAFDPTLRTPVCFLQAAGSGGTQGSIVEDMATERLMGVLVDAVKEAVLAAVREELAAHKEDVDELRRMLTAVGEGNDVTAAVGKERERELAAVKGVLEAVKGGLAAVKWEVASVKGEFAAMKGEVASLKGGFAAVKGEFAAVKGEFAAVKGELVALKGGVAAMKGGLAAVKVELA
ncbi:unnamed protein product [Closterium sp. NIES-64]|nr:unnamed protein product [Closterium sp. NIES-64]